mmetsp:Transcript_22451/g.71857  ORF Transcript_22451/g.71857 Transcript_22451/m.71857 type:complete len:232 (+) Transcript_22451:2565-3260(+)
MSLFATCTLRCSGLWLSALTTSTSAPCEMSKLTIGTSRSRMARLSPELPLLSRSFASVRSCCRKSSTESRSLDSTARWRAVCWCFLVLARVSNPAPCARRPRMRRSTTAFRSGRESEIRSTHSCSGEWPCLLRTCNPAPQSTMRLASTMSPLRRATRSAVSSSVLVATSRKSALPGLARWTTTRARGSKSRSSTSTSAGLPSESSLHRSAVASFPSIIAVARRTSSILIAT